VDLCARASSLDYETRLLPFPCVRHSRDGAIRSGNEASEIRLITLRNRFLFSLIHAKGAQRLLQPLGFRIRKVTAQLAGDTVTLTALREAHSTFSALYSGNRS
jgi:hypothetical protein